jgi:hypothetical protein
VTYTKTDEPYVDAEIAQILMTVCEALESLDKQLCLGDSQASLHCMEMEVKIVLSYAGEPYAEVGFFNIDTHANVRWINREPA